MDQAAQYAADARDASVQHQEEGCRRPDQRTPQKSRHGCEIVHSKNSEGEPRLRALVLRLRSTSCAIPVRRSIDTSLPDERPRAGGASVAIKLQSSRNYSDADAMK